VALIAFDLVVGDMVLVYEYIVIISIEVFGFSVAV